MGFPGLSPDKVQIYTLIPGLNKQPNLERISPILKTNRALRGLAPLSLDLSVGWI